jgi:hypothetical protein
MELLEFEKKNCAQCSQKHALSPLLHKWTRTNCRLVKNSTSSKIHAKVLVALKLASIGIKSDSWKVSDNKHTLTQMEGSRLESSEHGGVLFSEDIYCSVVPRNLLQLLRFSTGFNIYWQILVTPPVTIDSYKLYKQQSFNNIFIFQILLCILYLSISVAVNTTINKLNWYIPTSLKRGHAVA